MLTKSFSGSDRRVQTNKMIQDLLEERKQVWSLYCSVAGLEPFSVERPIAKSLQDFCQILVDYISLGHFGIYQRIVDGKERRAKVISMAEDIYSQIAEITDSAVSFNDKYEKLKGQDITKTLSEDLSDLGEKLAVRIELEDKLIETMLE